MEPILTIDNLNSFGGNMLRQGDKSQLKYRLRDVGNKNLGISGKSCQITMYGRNYTTIVYETTTTVSSDNTVSFTIDKVLPKGTFYLEFTVGDYIFPTDHREFFEITPSGKGMESNIIEIVGKDVLIQEVKSQVDAELQPLVTSMESAQQAEAQRVLAENERSVKYENYAQQFNDVILDLSEEKDYNSLPEISGARGGHETLGQRLDDTDAQLAQTDVTHNQMKTIKSLPVGSKDGSVKDFEYKGQTLVNLIENGDFSDGTTGWGHYRATSTVENKVVTITSTDVNPAFTKTKNFIEGNKYFLFTRMRALTGSGKLGIVFNNRYPVRINSPVIGQWYDLYTVIDKVGTLQTFELTYREGTVVGDQYQVDGNAGVFAIDMTALGIEDYTEEQMLELVRGGYFDGIKSAKADVKTVGKNLYDGEWEFGSLDVSKGTETWSTTRRRTLFIPVKPNTTYTISREGNFHIFGNQYDISKIGSYMDIRLETDETEKSFTTRADTRYIRFRNNDNQEFNNIQLEEGSTATPYEPYKSSTLTAEPTLHRLPNGVADRVFEQDGEMWLEKRVEYALIDGSRDWRTYNNTQTNIDGKSVVLDDMDSFGSIYTSTYTNGNSMLLNHNNNGIVASSSISAADKEIYAFGHRNRFYIVIPNEYTGWDDTKTVTDAEWKAYFSNNNYKLLYQLAEPELINLTEQGLVTGELMSYANGTSYNNGSLHGEVSFKVPTSTGAQITSLVDSSERQAKQIAVLSDHVAQLISGV